MPYIYLPLSLRGLDIPLNKPELCLESYFILILSLFKSITLLSNIRLIINDEMEDIWKKSFVICFMTLSKMKRIEMKHVRMYQNFLSCCIKLPAV